jgi:N-acetyl-D-muramate 6-phosphate phosphatase
MRVRPAAVLFDLDGTVIDSAPDLAAAANQLRLEHGLAALPYAQLRPMVGSGARGMVGTALGVVPGDARFEPLRDRFLALYEAGLLVQTQVFEHMVPVLDRLDAAGIPWGIVTNKAERFALPVIRGLGLDKRAGAVVCGDTTARAKPHPDPLLEAARRMQVAPAHCHYVGDDLRDIEAGRAAGMGTLAAAWGYLGEGEAIEDWGADLVLNVPNELLNWLELA